MSTDVDKARAELERAERRAAEARQRAEEAAIRESARRASAERQWDAAILGLYDADHYEREMAEAQAEFERIALEDPLVAAAIKLRVAQGRRQAAGILRNSTAQRLDEPSLPVAGPGLVDMTAAVAALVERKGAEAVADMEDSFMAARQEATSK